VPASLATARLNSMLSRRLLARGLVTRHSTATCLQPLLLLQQHFGQLRYLPGNNRAHQTVQTDAAIPHSCPLEAVGIVHDALPMLQVVLVESSMNVTIGVEEESFAVSFGAMEFSHVAAIGATVPLSTQALLVVVTPHAIVHLATLCIIGDTMTMLEAKLEGAFMSISLWVHNDSLAMELLLVPLPGVLAASRVQEGAVPMDQAVLPAASVHLAAIGPLVRAKAMVEIVPMLSFVLVPSTEP